VVSTRVAISSANNVADTEIEMEILHIFVLGEATQANSTAHRLYLHIDSLAHHFMLFSHTGEAKM